MKTRAKLACLMSFVGIWVTLLTGTDPHSRVAAFAEGPNAGHTGAPNELTCATSGCHTGTPNSGPGQLTITAPGFYQPGQTYRITVTHATTDSSRRRWGFQLTALDAGNHRAGSLQITSDTTQIVEGGPDGMRQYVEHSFNGTFPGQQSGATWSFNWVAPAVDAGPVTLYAAGNQANNDSNNTGDQIYTTKVVIFSGPPKILSVSVKGKNLGVAGENFADGATLFRCDACSTPATEGNVVRKTSNDEDSPTTLLIAKKAGKTIAPGQSVVLQVRNPDGAVSEPFTFMRAN